MPYANNQGVRIYYSVQGKGSPLVLHHGLTGSMQDWYDLGYVAALKKDYQVVLFDARGHGKSDKPHDPTAYELKPRILDVLAVLDDLDISEAHFFGHSMGAWIAFGLAKYAPGRFRSLIIHAGHPYERKMDALRGGISRGMDAVIALIEEQGWRMTPAQRARWLQNDTRALLASTQDRPDISDVLPNMHISCLLIAGEADAIFPQVKECVKHMPRATFVPLPGLNHAGSIVPIDLVLPHVLQFLKEVDQS